MTTHDYRGWIASALRWMLLFDACITVAFSLLTEIPVPVWNWPHCVLGMVVPEIGLFLAALPIVFATSAWWLRKQHPWITGLTIALCAFALVLFLKPVTQAQRVARALPGELTSAFGPATPSRKAFSIVTAFKPAPTAVATETFNYTRDLLLDFYRPCGRHHAPCIINIHGGSWVSGNRKNDGTQRWLNDHLAQLGYAVAFMDYRLAPASKWPAQREDVRAAIAYLKSHAAELDIDATRLVLLGRSAGGQMALVAGYSSNDPSIRGIISFYAPSDFRLTWEGATHPENLDHRPNLELFLGGTPDTATDAYDSASAAILAHPGAPPTLLLHGRLDINVFHREADRLAQKLQAAKVPHAVVTLPWAAHAFDLVNFNSPGAQVSTCAVEWFIEATTK